MKNTFLKILIASSLATSVAAQDFGNYKPLECKGTIPKEYTTSSAEKYKAEIEKLDGNTTKNKEKEARKQFALETNFALDELLQSGLVLFNDDVTVYLNEVMAKLIAVSDKNLNPEKVRVYALRSPSVNAFATDRGNVFVTLGLLAQLENEAQLAYILSHELVHFEKGHSLELFLETKDINKRSDGKEVLDESVFDENWIARCTYSKELESEADNKGLERFLKTEYSTSTLNTVFDVLKYSYLPFDEVTFDKEFFEGEYYHFPEGYWLTSLKPIKGEDEDSDDKASTHPNIANRRKIMVETLRKQPASQGKQNFIVSEERFRSLRQLTRLEIPMLHLHRDEWPDAVYAAYVLLKQYPDNLYLKKCIGKALYLQAIASDADYINENLKEADDVEGASQQVFHLMKKLTNKEACILAMRYNYALLKQNPEDAELKSMVEGLHLQMAGFVTELVEFNTNQQIAGSMAAAEEPAVDTSSTMRELSKYDKIRESKKNETTSPVGDEYWRYAFLDFLDDEAFVSGFQEGSKEHKAQKEREDYYKTFEGRRWLRRENERRKTEGYSLGIEKIVVVNPYYFQIDARKNPSAQYLQTEVGQNKMTGMIEQVAAISKLKVDILDVNSLDEKECDAFNDIRYLNEWFSEQINHYDMPLTIGTNQARINEIAEKYGTDYFLWTGTISLREKARGNTYYLLMSILFYPSTPFWVYKTVKPNYEMLHYSMLYDVRTGRRQTLKFDFFRKKTSEDMVKAHLYDTFSQINHKEAKE